ncbi:MAG: type VI secretion system tip protein VgrG [Candidatus Omnitrophica bacterium]|nr:type VI secretion system tip protein VgrG [Candidatus Omnitrophota bacterium]MCB9721937.1 type VI secretion system tip protein VgrG [Candidatus Omnitrophota bacterium]
MPNFLTRLFCFTLILCGPFAGMTAAVAAVKPPAQDRVTIEVRTPLGPNAFEVEAMEGEEELSGAYNFLLEVAGGSASIAPERLLGQPVTVSVSREGTDPWYYSGIINRFVLKSITADGEAIYRIRFVPKLWYLNLTSDARIFQEQSVPDIVATVLRENGVTDFRFALTDAYPVRECIVQYNETDFDFVNRLLGDEGIHYFFEHDASGHVMVITDTNGAGVDRGTLPYIPRSQVDKRLAVAGFIQVSQISRAVPGAYVHDDYTFRDPGLDLLTGARTDRGHALDDYEAYHYPGLYSNIADGERKAQIRLGAYNVSHRLTRGKMTGTFARPGDAVGLIGHPAAGLNGKYYVQSARHVFEPAPSGDGTTEHFFTIEIAESPIDVTYRPRVFPPDPVIPGPQPATVTGPAGAETYADDYSRVKVKFPWDRRSAADENSSCWVRVSQPAAGRIAVPEVGDEVLVGFEQGEPSRPIIIGRLWNGDDTPPEGGE